jgi:hypothetical protein
MDTKELLLMINMPINTYYDWEKIKCCVHQGLLIHGPLLFLLYIHDLQKIINTHSKQFLLQMTLV